MRFDMRSVGGHCIDQDGQFCFCDRVRIACRVEVVIYFVFRCICDTKSHSVTQKFTH